MITTPIKELLSIIDKKYNKKLSETELTSIALFDYPNPNSFQRFLMSDRVRKFLTMKILYHCCKEGKFVYGNESIGWSYRYEEEGDTNPPTREPMGPSIVPEIFNWEELFNYLLYNLGFDALLIKNKADIDERERMTEKEVNTKDEEWYSHPQNNVLVMIAPTLLILEEDTVHIPKDNKELQKKIQDAMIYFEKFFKAFLEEHKEKSVDHHIYIEWLLSWFPGAVHVKSLE